MAADIGPVLNLTSAAKLAATGIGIAAALMLGTNAHAAIDTSHPHLQTSVAGSLFTGTEALYPGSAPLTRTLTLTYTGGKAADSVGLYLAGYSSRGPATEAACTAADPGRGFQLAISSGGTELYRGTLADFAAAHASSNGLLTIPGSWKPGTSQVVTISVSMPRSDGNEYMSCSPTSDFVWFAG